MLLISIGCNQNSQEKNSDTVQNSTEKNEHSFPVVATTALPVSPFRKLPAPFALDSIFIEDTALNYVSSIYFPISDDEKFNISLEQWIDAQIKAEKPEHKTDNLTTFDLWITDLKTSKNLLHILFRQQTFTEGAAHHNHSYLTFNYDLDSKKKVSFTDVFKFSSSKSKQSFCNKLNGYVNGIDDSDGYKEGLTPEKLNENLNYVISNGRLIVYPNYCCAEKDKTFSVDLSSIQGDINPQKE